MYLQESLNPVVYRFKYYNNTSDVGKNAGRNDDKLTDRSASLPTVRPDNQQAVKSFLEPDDTEFAHIRKKLSTLSLTTEYKKDAFVPSPMFNERKYVPNRISSLRSPDIHGRKTKNKKRKGLVSRESFHSDDREYRIFDQKENDSLRRVPAITEGDSTYNLHGSVINPRQHPELFSQQIRFLSKSVSSRATSPKSSRSVDSSGKVHLGLIETLDLTEQLDDVEKIKQRYSGDYFTKSLHLYKARGHDRCFNRSGLSEHIPRGTRLLSPDSMRSGSKMSLESAQTMSSISTPFPQRSPHFRLTPMVLPHHYMQEHNSIQEHVGQHSTSQTDGKDGDNHEDNKKDRVKVRRKSVGFNMVPTEVHDYDVSSNNSSPRGDGVGKELKSILKKKKSGPRAKRVEIIEKEGDEFHANPSYYWKLQLPRIQSPAPSAKVRQATHFRKNMYHYGQGISDEFEEVINRYGNCRQNSMVRESSIVREPSTHITTPR